MERIFKNEYGALARLLRAGKHSALFKQMETVTPRRIINPNPPIEKVGTD